MRQPCVYTPAHALNRVPSTSWVASSPSRPTTSGRATCHSWARTPSPSPRQPTGSPCASHWPT